MQVIVPLLLAAIVIFCILKPKSDFVIKVHDEGLWISGQVSQSASREISRFFERDAGHLKRIKVYGTYCGRDRLQLRFSGELSPGDQQQIRNFLSTLLFR